MNIFFELSLDNYIEIIESSANLTAKNIFLNLDEAIDEIATRNFSKCMHLYQNKGSSFVISAHMTIKDLKEILYLWDEGFNYEYDLDIGIYRNQIKNRMKKYADILCNIK